MIEELLKRLPAEETDARDLVSTMLRIPGALKTKADAVRGDADLSEPGKARKIKELATGDMLAHFKQCRARATAMGTEVDNLGKAMQPKAIDRTDLSAEMRRAELRAFVRSIPAGERLRFILDNEAVAVAALDAPPALSGLNDELFGRIKDAHVEKLYGAQIAGLEKRKAIVEVVSAAAEIATKQFAAESGLTVAEIAA